MASRRFRIGGPYSFLRPSVFWRKSELTGQAGATLAEDWFDSGVAANPTLALSVTEGADTPSFTVRARQRVALSVTEGADTPSFTVRARQRVALSVTEGPDTPAFVIGARHRVALSVTEGSDTPSFTVRARQRVALSVTEGADTPSFTVSVSSLASQIALSTTEAPDTPVFEVRAAARPPENTPGFLEPREYARARRKREREAEEEIDRILGVVRKKQRASRPNTPAPDFSAEIAQAQQAILGLGALTSALLDLLQRALAEIEAARAIEQARRADDDEAILAIVLALTQ